MFCRWLRKGKVAEIDDLWFALSAKASWSKMTNGKQNYRVFPRRNFGGNWSRWSEFTAVFLRWICRAASLGKPLCVERKPFTVQLLNGRKSAHGPQGRDVTHILCKVSYFFLLKSFHFRRLRKRSFFHTRSPPVHTNPYISNLMQQCQC